MLSVQEFTKEIAVHVTSGPFSISSRKINK